MSSSRLNTPAQTNGGSRPTTPRPPVGAGRASTEVRGLLMIQIVQGRGLQLPAGATLPDAIVRALGKHGHSLPLNPAPGGGQKGTRDSVQRKRYWWLPYIVLEFDKNEILVDALAGDVSSPIWAYRAHFDVSRQVFKLLRLCFYC
jgi:serum/glucocorticoid-regulated kinase 2